MVQDIFKGVAAYFSTLSLISKLKLWKYFAIPMLISFITAVIISVVAYAFSDEIGNYIATFWKWDFGKSTFKVISTFLSGLIILTIGLLLYRHIVMALSAPFMSPVSEKIERYLTGDNHLHINTSFQQQLIRGVRINLRNLLKELFLTIPILLFGFIPVIGFLSTVLLFLLQSYYAGFGNMDYTLERHFKYKDSIAFMRKNRGIAIGNGIVFMLILLIPVVGVILVLPFSTTAATVQTVKRLQLSKQ